MTFAQKAKNKLSKPVLLPGSFLFASLKKLSDSHTGLDSFVFPIFKLASLVGYIVVADAELASEAGERW